VLEDTLKKLIALSVLGLVGMGLGCNKDSGTVSKSAGGSSIGVVDPDRVFRAMGWGDEVQKNVNAAENELRRQVEAHLAPMRAAFEQKKAGIFSDAKLTKEQIDAINTKPTTRAEMEKMGLTPKQIEDLFQGGAVWQSEVRSANAAAQQVSSQRNAGIQNNYRDTVAPVIRRVASNNGRTVIFTPAQLAYFDPSVDLTDKVVDEIQKTPSIKLTLPEMPKVDFGAMQAGVPAGPTTAPAGPMSAPTSRP
jgi:Skp family chaperone for outer membrane proteins